MFSTSIKPVRITLVLLFWMSVSATMSAQVSGEKPWDKRKAWNIAFQFNGPSLGEKISDAIFSPSSVKNYRNNTFAESALPIAMVVGYERGYFRKLPDLTIEASAKMIWDSYSSADFAYQSLTPSLGITPRYHVRFNKNTPSLGWLFGIDMRVDYPLFLKARSAEWKPGNPNQFTFTVGTLAGLRIKGTRNYYDIELNYNTYDALKVLRNKAPEKVRSYWEDNRTMVMVTFRYGIML